MDMWCYYTMKIVKVFGEDPRQRSNLQLALKVQILANGDDRRETTSSTNPSPTPLDACNNSDTSSNRIRNKNKKCR